MFDRNFFTHAFRYVSPGNWQETSDTAVTPPGGTFWSFLSWSHNQDSVADIIQTLGQGSATLDVGFRTGTADRRSLGVISVTLATADTTCTGRTQAWTDTTTHPATFYPQVCLHSIPAGAVETDSWTAAFGLTGGQILVGVSKVRHDVTSISGFSVCPGQDPSSTTPPPNLCRSASFLESTESTDIWSVPTNGGQPHLLWPFPKFAFWLAGSEDGKQLVTGEGQWQQTSRLNLDQTTSVDSLTFTGCGVAYRRATSGAEATPLVPTFSVCRGGGQGQGTISPAPWRHP